MDKDTFKKMVATTHGQGATGMESMIDSMVEQLLSDLGEIKEHDEGMYDIVAGWTESLRTVTREVGTNLKEYVMAHYDSEGNKLF